jgi:carbonic anhydrase/acetyltransferase-like protein (isoleucine patch superfamily)
MTETDLPENTLERDPTVDATAFIARGAVVVGDVRLGAHCSIWYNAVLRGDINSISVGEYSNIQDGCIMHVDNDRPCVVADHVTVGHGVILHGCTIETGCLIGMGSIVLSGAVIGRGSVVAAGAVVLEGQRVEPFSLVAGVPARLVRSLEPASLQTNYRWAAKYADVARLHARKGCGAQP